MTKVPVAKVILKFFSVGENVKGCNETCCKNTCLWGLPPGPIQTGLYYHIRRLEARNFRFSKKRDCTIYVAKTKAQISCSVNSQLICAFVF